MPPTVHGIDCVVDIWSFCSEFFDLRFEVLIDWWFLFVYFSSMRFQNFLIKSSEFALNSLKSRVFVGVFFSPLCLLGHQSGSLSHKTSHSHYLIDIENGAQIVFFFSFLNWIKFLWREWRSVCVCVHWESREYKNGGEMVIGKSVEKNHCYRSNRPSCDREIWYYDNIIRIVSILIHKF